MVLSEQLELRIFNFAELAGKARWRAVDLGTLENSVLSQDTAVLVNALFDLHARNLTEFRQWSYESSVWIGYGGGDREYFYRPFEIRVTFTGRKYFERLAEQAAGSSREPDERLLMRGDTLESVPHATSPGTTPQVITPPSPPTAFVSHSGQDRDFVESICQRPLGSGHQGVVFPVGDKARRSDPKEDRRGA